MRTFTKKYLIISIAFIFNCGTIISSKKSMAISQDGVLTLEHKRTKPPVAFFYDENKKENDK